MTVYSASLYEVQKYFMKTDYIRDVSAIFISDALWNQLSDNQKAVLSRRRKKAVRTEEATIASQIDDVIAKAQRVHDLYRHRRTVRTGCSR